MQKYVPLEGAWCVHVMIAESGRRLHLEMVGVVDPAQRHRQRHVLEHAGGCHARRLHCTLEVVDVMAGPHLHVRRCCAKSLSDFPICAPIGVHDDVTGPTGRTYYVATADDTDSDATGL